MNKSYKVVFNKNTGQKEVVSELAKSRQDLVTKVERQDTCFTKTKLGIVVLCLFLGQMSIADNLLIGAGGGGGGGAGNYRDFATSATGAGGAGGGIYAGQGGDGDGAGNATALPVQGGVGENTAANGESTEHRSGNIIGGTGGIGVSSSSVTSNIVADVTYDAIGIGGSGGGGGGGSGNNGGEAGKNGANANSNTGGLGGIGGGNGGPANIGNGGNGGNGTDGTLTISDGVVNVTNLFVGGQGGHAGGGGGDSKGGNGGNGGNGSLTIDGYETKLNISTNAEIGGKHGLQHKNSYGTNYDNKSGQGGIGGNGTLQMTGDAEIVLNDNATLNINDNGLLVFGDKAFLNTVSGGSITGSSNAKINNNNRIEIHSEGENLITVSITGTGSLLHAGEGVVNLTADNTYTGSTVVTNGILRLGVAGRGSPGSEHGSVTSDIELQSSARLEIWRSNDYTYEGKITGTGLVRQEGIGTTIFTNVHTYSGATTINKGTLQLGDGGTTGSITSDSIIVNQNGTLAFNRNNEYAYGGIISGKGFVIQQGTGTTIFTNAHTYIGETKIADGILQIGNGGTTGSIASNIVSIQDAGTLSFNRSDEYAYAGLISGDGKVVQDGSGTLTLANANTYTGGTNVNDGSLVLTNISGAGTGGIAINTTNANGLVLNLNNTNDTENAAFSNVLSGSGSTKVEETKVIITGDNNSYSGAWNITSDSNVTALQLNTNLGSGALNVDGSLTTNTAAINNQLTGAGIVNADINNQELIFSSKVGTAFTGTLALTNGSFDVNNSASTAPLLNGTLSLGSGSSTVVTTDNRTIGNLTLAGGTVNIGLTANGGVNVLNANHLSSTSNSSLNIDTAQMSAWNPTTPGQGSINTTNNLINQANRSTNADLQLISATSIDPDSIGAQVALTINGNALGSDLKAIVGLTDSEGNQVNGTYNYTGLVIDDGTDKGVYTDYVLTEIDVTPSGALKLTTDGANYTGFGAKITGAGNVDFNANDATDILVIHNNANDYIGKTSITGSGTVKMGADNVFGTSSNNLDVSSVSTLDLNANTLELEGFLDNQGIIDIADGHLSLNDATLGSLKGTGDLTLSGAVLATNDNTDLNVNTRITETSTVTLEHIYGLGRGTIDTLGELSVNNLSGVLENRLTGDGTLSIHNDSNITLSDSENFNGLIQIDLDNGLTLLNLGQTASIENDGLLTYDVETGETRTLYNTNSVTGSGDFIKTGSGILSIEGDLAYTGETDLQAGELWFTSAESKLSGSSLVTVNSDAALRGTGEIAGHVINNGLFAVGINNTNSTVSDIFRVGGDFTNSGVIDFSNGGLGSQLFIAGNYIGENGIINLKTALGNDNSATDKVIITGNAQGTTNLHVSNVNGLGALTHNGIKVVEVSGLSDIGAFSLNNYVAAGNYEYILQQQGNDWVLASHEINPVGSNPQYPTTPYYRVDAGLNMGVGSAAVNLLTPNLGSKMLGGNRGDKLNNVWMITDYFKNKGLGGGNQLSYNNTIKGIQLGADHKFIVGDQSFILGIMGSMHRIDGHSLNRMTGSRATSDTNAYGFGLYGTWYFNNSDLTPYIDGMIQYQSFKTTNKTKNNPNYSYNSKGYSASVLGGYPIALTDSIILEPQIQLSYINYSSSSFRDHAGNVGKSKLKGNFIGRIGTMIEFNRGGVIEPYAGLHMWYDNTNLDTRYGNSFSAGNTSINSRKNGLMFEGKIGFKAKPTKDLTIGVEFNGLKGKRDKKDYGVSIGIKYNF